jgi:hypothetical protein
VVVHTNDPHTPVVELMVSGSVEPFADIQPKHVRLIGRLGEPADAVVQVVGRPDRPFKVKNVRATNGRHIRFSLADLSAGGHTFYEITITSARQDTGTISDVILLDTDSPIRPTLQVTVFGMINEAKKTAP